VFKDLVLGRIKLVELRVRYALSFVATLEKTRRGKLRKESPLGREKKTAVGYFSTARGVVKVGGRLDLWGFSHTPVVAGRCGCDAGRPARLEPV